MNFVKKITEEQLILSKDCKTTQISSNRWTGFSSNICGKKGFCFKDHKKNLQEIKNQWWNELISLKNRRREDNFIERSQNRRKFHHRIFERDFYQIIIEKNAIFVDRKKNTRFLPKDRGGGDSCKFCGKT